MMASLNLTRTLLILLVIQACCIMHLMSVIYPTKIKDIVSKMTQVTQKALQNRNSRMEIELPPTADFGVESAKNPRNAASGLSTADQIKRSNRESARLFTDMFSTLSSTTSVLFPTETEASTARNLWGAAFRGKVLSIDSPGAVGFGKLRSRKFSAIEQEQALFSSDGIYVPSETEVLIIAGPRSKDVAKVMKISQKLTDATLIILLNARASALSVLSSEQSTDDTKPGSFVDWVDSNYVNVFHYAPPVLIGSVSEVYKKKELLLYHEFENKWSLAVKEASQGGILGAIGSLTGVNTLWQGDQRPTPNQIADIIQKLSKT